MNTVKIMNEIATIYPVDEETCKGCDITEPGDDPCMYCNKFIEAEKKRKGE